MKFVIISDTHGRHHQLSLPEGDVVIHAGDVSGRGLLPEIRDFLNWFEKLNFKYKIFIAGNHDFYFESIDDFQREGIIYLNDSRMEINGIKIWGSPIQPEFHNWAFNRKRGEEIKEHWDLIPSDTDILITHGPPYSILDKTINLENVGCEELLTKVQSIKPKFHLFGHVHEGYGIDKNDLGTIFINASVLDERYRLKNDPITFELMSKNKI